MPCAFGIIVRAELLNNELCLTGQNYVAVAFDRDDPYLITRFVGVNGILPLDIIELLSSASDIYDSEVTDSEDGLFVHFRLNNETDIDFRCSQIVTEYRYYTPEEIAEILKWLPSKCTAQQLLDYVSALRKHGFSTTLSGKTVVVERLAKHKLQR